MRLPSALIKLSVALALLVIVAMSGTVARAGAARPETGKSFVVGTLASGVHPRRLAIASDGIAWYSGNLTFPQKGLDLGTGEAGFIGHLNRGGRPTRIALGDGTRAGAPVATPDGDVWFPESHEERGGTTSLQVVGYSPTGGTQSYPVGAGVTEIAGTAQLGGDIWFSGTAVLEGAARGVIGRVDLGAAGTVALFPLEPDCGAGGAITATADRIWFGESCPAAPSSGPSSERSALAEVDASGKITRLPLPTGDRPVAVTAASDTSVWVGMENPHYRRPTSLVHLDASGSLTSTRVRGANFPGMAVGPEGRLWFAALYPNFDQYDGLASIGPAGRRTRVICVTRNDYCELGIEQLAAGPQGELWWAAGLAPSHAIGGGGGSGLIEGEDLQRSRGFIGRVR
jgi:streptogramin lyase